VALKIEGSTLKFLACRTSRGVEINASFEAGEAGEMTEEHQMRAIIDPIERTLELYRVTRRNRCSSGSVVYEDVRKVDKRLLYAREVRDIFFTKRAWEILKDSPENPRLLIDGDGTPREVRSLSDAPYEPI
jgi:hypothetical protein